MKSGEPMDLIKWISTYVTVADRTKTDNEVWVSLRMSRRGKYRTLPIPYNEALPVAVHTILGSL